MVEYADMEIERQQQSYADKARADHDKELRRAREATTARAALQNLGLTLVQKTAFHYHMTKARKVIAQWWPALAAHGSGTRSRGRVGESRRGVLAVLRQGVNCRRAP